MVTVLKDNIMKHTKGKWRIKNKINIKTINGKCIADIWGFDVTEKEIEANAKLIASAPELLESLIELENIVSLLVDFDGKSVYKDETKKARNTIKKATQ